MRRSEKWVPRSTSCPSRMTRICIASTTVHSLCATTTLVRLAKASSSTRCTALSVSESSALVGSSQSTTAGWASNARAIATRWRSPPERLSPLSPTLES
mmetsp:Transcript_35502/g.58819  ORF Transcript_35502/g.58819 Transcript_35502/m.58819 type:complete len:99 (-) Transcript_35502:279-575(-)